MNHSPDRILSMAALMVLPFLAATGNAQHKAGQLPDKYPGKPIRMLVGSAPGGGADITARAVAQNLTERLGRPVVVDNRGGGGGIISLELLAQAPADGYTLYGGAALIITATPMNKVPFDTRKVFVPVVQMTSSSALLIITPSLQVNSVKELIAYARSKPGALSYASAGIGSTAHLGTELLKFLIGNMDIVHVPYKGYGQALTDLMGGQIQMAISSGIAATPHLRSGRLKAIAVTGLRRMQAFPELPTVSESGVPGFNLETIYGLYAPAGVPPAIVLAINREVNRFMATPDMKLRLASDGAEAAPSNSPAEFRDVFDKEVGKWEIFFRKSGIEVER